MTNPVIPIGMDSVSGLERVLQPGDTTLISGNLGNNGTAPTFTAGTGAGTSPTISISGNSFMGIVTVLTGTFPTGSNAPVVTLNLANAFPNTCLAAFLPANAAAAALSGSGSLFGAGSGTNAAILTSGVTGLIGATTYKFTYILCGW